MRDWNGFALVRLCRSARVVTNERPTDDDYLRYGFGDDAQRLRRTLLELVERGGFREYYDPLTGEGHGTDDFSWTAALLIDTLAADG